MGDTLLVVLGAALALATSFVVELWKNYSVNKNQLRNFKTVLKLELKHLSTIIDKLTEDYGINYYFPFLTLDQLDRNLNRLEAIRRDAVFLKDDNKKEEVLEYINDVLVFSSDLRGLENYAFSPTNAATETVEEKQQRLDFCAKKRPLYSLKTVDLKRRVKDLIDYLDKK